MSAKRKIILFSLFAVAMAYLESAIVVYLRILYYPDGFRFPILIIPTQVEIIEIGREAATIIMLWVVAFIGGHNFKERFALFMLNFGIWDLFYYLWLKVFLDWPARWLDWDLLFLIPAPWVAPWLTPALVSIALIGAGILVLTFPKYFPDKILIKSEWWLVIIGGLVILSSFFWQTAHVIKGDIPDYYPWWLFLSGYFLGIFVFIRRFLSGIQSKM